MYSIYTVFGFRWLRYICVQFSKRTFIFASRGLKIASGLAAEITMKLVEVERINTATRSCAAQLSSPKYLRSECVTECANSLIQETCGCGLGISQYVERQCDMEDESESNCVNQIFDPEDGIIRHKVR